MPRTATSPTEAFTASRSQPCGEGPSDFSVPTAVEPAAFYDPQAAFDARMTAQSDALAIELAKHRTPGKWLPITDGTGPDVGGIVGVARSYGWKPEDER